MHYTGTIWRPPYEASSQLIEVTAGCTHHKCKFCTLYKDLPFDFTMSPLQIIEEDLKEVCESQKLYDNREIKRVFLTGANPFALKFDHLKQIAQLIHKYLPECKTIGCFARITDITQKTDDQLMELSELGFDSITIGVETGDEQVLDFMNKGYKSDEIILQSRRLDKADINYNYFYLTGLSGKNRGIQSALETARVFNQTNPQIIGSSMLTIDPESELYEEIQSENWEEQSELEKIEELKTLIQYLNTPAYFSTLGASNAIFVQGQLPKDKGSMVSYLNRMLKTQNEKELRHYRTHLKHL